MVHEFSRQELIIGEEKLNILRNKHVAVFGVGGVGSYVTEAFARCGIGKIDLYDNDKVSLTNINRQLIALHSTVGRDKVLVMKERILDINPACIVKDCKVFIDKNTVDNIDFSMYDYVIDAVDTVTAKLLIIERCKEKNVPVISSMGTGNKLHPELFEIADISKTSVCPLAKVMRKELKARKIEGVKVLYSKELPVKPGESEEISGKRQTPGSMAFTPSAAGLIIAGEAVRDMIKEGETNEVY
ncbi:MAG: ThiF family adenylyltransferase [Coprococcus sp.]